jgi:superfamily I DNA/RNA helicase
MSATATTEQLNVFNEVTTGVGNLLVEARAGTGKTWTLVEAMKLIRMLGMRSTAMPTVALAAYNKKIAKELDEKIFAAALDNATVGTFHSYGFKAWRMAHPKAKLETFKKWDRLVIECQIPLLFQPFVKKAIGLAKQRAIGYLTALNDPTAWLDLVAHFDLDQLLEEGEADLNPNISWDAAPSLGGVAQDRDAMIREALQCSCKVLKRSIDISDEMIDFDDMIYMPLMMKTPVIQYDWVLVDEAQDTNPVRREFAKRMMKPEGRAIFVGDPNQAIYGFTGADNDSLEIIRKEFNAKVLPLTMTFRCAKVIVEVARTLVPDYRAFEGNAEGEYRVVDQKDFDAEGPTGFDFTPGRDAILCRNTKPLVDIAFRLIRRGIACHVEGKDIGKDLIKLVMRWKTIKTCRALATKLESYREAEVNKLLAKKKEMQAEMLADRVDTVLAIIGGIDQHATVIDLKNKIDGMFSDTPDGEKAKTVTLMTAHRSKGLEYDRVFLYGRNKFMPSKYAIQDWQIAQEENLKYVAITRAINTLIEVKVL